MYADTKGEIVPLCRSKQRAFDVAGCPIESIATDDKITDTIERFEIAKMLGNLSGMPESQRKIFEDIGLLDDPILHIRMELIWAKKQKANGNAS